jgi:UDP-4-amino-4,6-dideoxy-N-acetyl-beta-L-altrosamine transaminase
MKRRMRDQVLPYGRQEVRDDDRAAVDKVLRSDWLTTGPKIPEFESAFCREVEAPFAVAVSSGTAALHTAMAGAGVGPGDEVVVAAMTFAASSNVVLYRGATPRFADVDPDTLLLRIDEVERLISPRTRAVLAVDYAGQPCDYDALAAIARDRGLKVIDDACHALGARYHGCPVGSITDFSCFSFHPVKHITTGEGGMVTTADGNAARRMRAFRNHGITTNHRERAEAGTADYDMVELGFNYRLTDFQAALGISQLSRLKADITTRHRIAAKYDAALAEISYAAPLRRLPNRIHAYHLYVVRFDTQALGMSQSDILAHFRSRRIGANAHYRPPYLHPYYRDRLGTGEGLCPVAERAAREIITLPLFPSMTNIDIADVIEAVRELGA